MARPVKLTDAHRERLYRLAASLEAKENATSDEVYPDEPQTIIDKFSMHDYRFKCGSPACVAGWANEQRLDDEGNRSEVRFFNEGPTAFYLGLSGRNIDAMFSPSISSFCDYSFGAAEGSECHITATHAAACLRHYADTGVVDWNAAKERELKDAAND